MAKGGFLHQLGFMLSFRDEAAKGLKGAAAATREFADATDELTKAQEKQKKVTEDTFKAAVKNAYGDQLFGGGSKAERGSRMRSAQRAERKYIKWREGAYDKLEALDARYATNFASVLQSATPTLLAGAFLTALAAQGIAVENALQEARMSSIAAARQMDLVSASAISLRSELGASHEEAFGLVTEMAKLKVAPRDMKRFGEASLITARALQMNVQEAAQLQHLLQDVWRLGHDGALSTAGAVRRVADMFKITTAEALDFIRSVEPLILRVETDTSRSRLTGQLAAAAGIFKDAGLDPSTMSSLFRDMLDPLNAEATKILGFISSEIAGSTVGTLRDELQAGDLTNVMQGLFKLAGKTDQVTASIYAQQLGISAESLLQLKRRQELLGVFMDEAKLLDDTDASQARLNARSIDAMATLTQGWEQLKNAFMGLLQALGTPFIKMVGDVFQLIAKGLKPIAQYAIQFNEALSGAPGMVSGLGTSFLVLKGVLAAVGVTLSAAFWPVTAVIGAIVAGYLIWKKWPEETKSFLKTWWKIQKAVLWTINPLARFIMFAVNNWGEITKGFDNFMRHVRNIGRLWLFVWEAFFRGAAKIGGVLMKIVFAPFFAIRTILSNLGWWEPVVGTVKTAFEAVVGFVKGLFQGILDFITGGVNKLIGYYNSMSSVIPGWEPLDPVAGSATKLGTGGVVMPRPGGVPAILAEQGQPEIVAPAPLLQNIVHSGSDLVVDAVEKQTDRLLAALRRMGEQQQAAVMPSRGGGLREAAMRSYLL